MKAPARPQNITIVLVLMLVAVGLRVYGIGWGLPHVYEEATPLKEAWEMWGWGSQRGLDLNPHFFHYPSLFIYIQFIGQGLLYIGMRLFGLVDSTVDYQALYVIHKTPFYIVGRLITALFSVATVWVTYLIGRRILGRAIAISAAFLLAINTFHISKSQVVEVDVPATCFAALALWLSLRLLEDPRKRTYLLAGLSVGLATSTKYTAALLVLPLLAAHLLARRETVRDRHLNSIAGRRKPAWGSLVLSLAIAVLAFLATSPFILPDASTFSLHFSMERQHMRLGHFGLGETSTWLFYAKSLTDKILGWPLTLLAFGGFAYLVAVRRRSWALVLAAFFVPYLIAIASWVMKADRYLLPVLPVALLFAGGICAEAFRLERLARAPRTWRLSAAVLVTLLLGWPLLAAYPNHLIRLRPDTRTEAKKWIETNVPAGAFIVVEPYGPELLGPKEFSSLEADVRRSLLESKHKTLLYAIQPLPMFQVKPELSEAFYDLSLYEVADMIITSSGVRSRYLADPSRFRHQVAFYDSLENGFQKVRVFLPQRKTGPTVIIYKNPRQGITFQERRAVKGPRVLSPSRRTAAGARAIFYDTLGLNYETYGYFKEALDSYEMGFACQITHPQVFKNLALGKTRCLLALGEFERAADFLEKAAAAGPTPESREYFLHMRQEIISNIHED